MGQKNTFYRRFITKLSIYTVLALHQNWQCLFKFLWKFTCFRKCRATLFPLNPLSKKKECAKKAIIITKDSWLLLHMHIIKIQQQHTFTSNKLWIKGVGKLFFFHILYASKHKQHASFSYSTSAPPTNAYVLLLFHVLLLDCYYRFNNT